MCRQGQTLEVKVAAYPEMSFTGEVYFVAPFVEPELRTTLVKARIANEESLLKPGMFATVDLTLTVREEAIVIPEPALFRSLDEERAMVYVIDQAGQAQMRTVRVGERKARKVEILQGLTAGEEVDVRGCARRKSASVLQWSGLPPKRPRSTSRRGHEASRTEHSTTCAGHHDEPGARALWGHQPESPAGPRTP